MAKEKCNFAKMYSSEPELYDELSWAEDKKNAILKFLFKKVSFRNKIVLDIGAGTCKFPILLSKYCKKVYALEPSKPMLSVGIKKIQKLGIKNIEPLKGKAEKIPLKSKSVDIVISTWAFLQSSVDLKKGLKESLRVLRNRGKIFIVDCDYSGEFLEIWRKTNLDTIMGDILNMQLSLLDLYKFKKYKIRTSFDFQSVKRAAEIMGFIFGNKFRDYILKNKKSKIAMDVAIFHGVN